MEIAIPEEKNECEGLLEEFVESTELSQATILFVARKKGPIEEDRLDELSYELAQRVQLRVHMISLVEKGMLEYVGNKKWRSKEP